VACVVEHCKDKRFGPLLLLLRAPHTPKEQHGVCARLFDGHAHAHTHTCIRP
jgi:hypothetical protein